MEVGVAGSSRNEQSASADRTSTLDLPGLTRRLPCSKYDPSASEARKRMFETFDTSGDGSLSLLDVQNGLRVVLKECGSKALDALAPAVSRAFHAAKDAASSGKGGKVVCKGEEFRLLLVFLKRYFEVRERVSSNEAGACQAESGLRASSCTPSCNLQTVAACFTAPRDV